MKSKIIVENIPNVEINLEEMIDHFFETCFGVEIRWEEEAMGRYGYITLGNVDFEGDRKKVQNVLEIFGIDLE